jgi:hypothetical protein
MYMLLVKRDQKHVYDGYIMPKIGNMKFIWAETKHLHFPFHRIIFKTNQIVDGVHIG